MTYIFQLTGIRPTVMMGIQLNAGTYKVVSGIAIAMIVAGIILIALGLLSGRKKPAAPQKSSAAQPRRPSVYVSSINGDREYQQDSYAHSGALSPAVTDVMGVMGVVCDGMGGMQGGEIASRACADMLCNGYYQLGGTDDICGVLRHLILAADNEISRIHDAQGRLLKCGTTAVAAVVLDKTVYWASTGDSRIYLIRGGVLTQLTRDHNFQLKLMEDYAKGLCTREEVERNPQRNALISYVGKGSNLLVDTGKYPFEYEKGDVLLLCSDGVYKTLSDNAVKSIVLDHKDKLSQLPEAISSAAYASGNVKHDNITVVSISK